ncbi:hypothetical protein KCU71_g3514, partial [Aureobasidium melanogenum]
MPGLLQLPPELLAHIVEFVAVSEPAPIDPYDYDDENKYKAINDPAFSNWNPSPNRLAVTPRPDVASLQNLRLASRQFSHACATHLYCCARLLPTEGSATRYNEILSTPNVAQLVQKVIFQTRMVPGGSTSCYARQHPGEDDDYREPHPFFMDALGRVGRFPNLTHVELAFSITCCGPSGFTYGDETEDVEFREEVLSAFYAGLNHPKHPAAKVYDLGIKNLQDITPQVLIDSAENTDNGFKKDFQQVMSRITRFSLQVATEEDEASPENELHIPEIHDFFGHELETYWLAPIANNLLYLKLYASTMLFGMYPRCNLPRFPRLRKLLLGNLSVVNDDQIDWILSHAATLEELTLDDAIIGIGARFTEQSVDVINRRVNYLPLKIEDGRPCYRPQPTLRYTPQRWLWSTRWHHIFNRFQHGLPHLKYFAFGHGNRGENASFDEAEALTCELETDRYHYFDEGSGPSNWLSNHYHTKAYKYREKDKDEIVYHPECDEEDWQALKDLVHELKKKRR